MVNQDLGKVAVVARGAYDPKVEYERLDAVTYNGSSYLVRQRCRGVTPAEGTYYMLIPQRTRPQRQPCGLPKLQTQRRPLPILLLPLHRKWWTRLFLTLLS